jgi:hypothetical protein
MKLQGLPVDRSTLAFWVGVAAAELKPVYLRMKEILLSSAKIAVDETRAPVPATSGRSREMTGRGAGPTRRASSIPMRPAEAASTRLLC